MTAKSKCPDCGTPFIDGVCPVEKALVAVRKASVKQAEASCWRCGPAVKATHKGTDAKGKTWTSCYGHVQVGWTGVSAIEACANCSLAFVPRGSEKECPTCDPDGTSVKQEVRG